MNPSRLEIGGAVVYWRLCQATSLPELTKRFRALGLENSIPEPRTPLSCLRGVMAEMFRPPDKEQRYVVRPVKNEHPGFAVVTERPKEHARPGDDWGKVVVSAKLEENGGVDLDPFDWDQREQITARMREAAQYLPQATVAKALVGLIESLGGVCLRDSGGVYWLNDSELDRWAEIADAVESSAASTEKPSHVYSLRVIADEQMARAVGDALSEEVEKAVSDMESELAKGDLKEEACLTRLRRAGKLSEKVSRYENAFGTPLARLQEACQRAAAAAAMAALQNSASQA